MQSRLQKCTVNSYSEHQLSALSISSAVTGFAGEVVAVGVNTRKGGSDPELKPAPEYPHWVAELATPQGNIFDLRKKMASAGQENLEFQEVELHSFADLLQICCHQCDWNLI